MAIFVEYTSLLDLQAEILCSKMIFPRKPEAVVMHAGYVVVEKYNWLPTSIVSKTTPENRGQ